jgi:ferric-dicitrate binding protein FerR (iron transport regulator)
MTQRQPSTDGGATDRAGAASERRRARARRRVGVELATIVGVLALVTALRWVDATTPSILPVLQA